ncbi:catalase-related domain-containing protein [Sphingomonas sp.]|jgi:catalase|uniref:catalase-related domain-containing protein n=1 Tax=Sphingomonas sp. TaxID=28214 RepID=UPI00260ECD5D|nr:catalase-related domain-containing protein [Sphingomonas sp.]MDF2603001.1 catalase [Sphingomonas sp.]
MRVRTELFADHYSQARLFYGSQTPAEQAHITSSFVFELSKVDLFDQIPPRMVANFRNVDEDLARRVADGLGIDLLEKATAAREPVDLSSSGARSASSSQNEATRRHSIAWSPLLKRKAAKRCWSLQR